MLYWKTQKLQPSMLCKSSSVTKAIASAFYLPTIDHTKAAQVSWSSLGKGLVIAEIKNSFCYGGRGQREAWYLIFPRTQLSMLMVSTAMKAEVVTRVCFIEL